MNRFIKRLFLLLLLVGLVPVVLGTSFIGPPKDFEQRGFGGLPAGLGYSLAGDIGAAMTPLETYRWNVPIITYAFDESFINYFGNAGMAAVSNAFKILNDLPPFSTTSRDLSEFPWDSKQALRYSPSFGTLGLQDIKSMTLAALLEHMGLAKPERFVWGLRGRFAGNGFTNYSTVMLNFDPVTLNPSRYVNGVLYHYQILEPLGPMGGEWASAIEFFQDDPFYVPYSAVAGGLGSSDFELLDAPGLLAGVVSGLGPGEFYTGLSRDDIGGLKYLYGPNNFATENLLASIVGGQPTGNSGSPWTPFFNNTNVFLGTTNALFNTNAIGTNNLIVQGLRPGVNHITFQRVDFDSLLGQTLIPVTNRFTDTVITNGQLVIQPVERASLVPDILFGVQDLGLVFEVPVTFRRNDTSTWQNNDAINGATALGGPGVIQPTATFLFTDVLPYFLNFNPGDALDDSSPFGSFVWASFDGTTNAPVIFPNYLNITLQDLQNVVLGGSTP